jgi:hypothetical protein
MNPTTCQTCRYWRKDHGDIGCCFFRAPHVMIFGQSCKTVWPHTHASNWCGEWEARP